MNVRSGSAATLLRGALHGTNGTGIITDCVPRIFRALPDAARHRHNGFSRLFFHPCFHLKEKA
jgi:hypothetical protein